MRKVLLPEVLQFARNGLSIKQDKSSGGVGITRIETIASGFVDESRLGYAGVSDGQHEDRYLQTGDILFSHINSPIHVGKCALYSGGDTPLIHGMNLLCLRPQTKLVFPQFLLYTLKSGEYRGQLERYINRAVNQASVSISNLSKTSIPLPPLDEQKRIAAILDAADDLRAKRREAIQQLDELLQATFLDLFGDPVTNPKGWGVRALGEIFKVKSGNGLTAKEMATNGQHPVYGGNGINGYHDAYMFEKPMIVLGRVGVYCGAVHLTQPKAWITDNALYVHETFKPIETTYLVAALTAADLNQYAGRAAQPLISGSRIYPVPIPLPPLPLQQKFATIVSTIEKQKARHRSQLTELDTLFASLQSRAFKGEF